MRKHLLVIVPEIPYPVRKNGFTVRYYPLLKEIARHLDITLAYVTSRNVAGTDLGDLPSFVKRCVPLKRSGIPATLLDKARANLSSLMPCGVPHAFHHHDARDIARQIRPLLTADVDIVLWATLLQSHYLAQCLPDLKGKTLVLDAMDSIYLHVSRQGKPGLARAARSLKMRRWESKIVAATQLTFFISPVDRNAIAPFVPRSTLKISPNGVAAGDFTAAAAQIGSPSIGFLGNMSYRPNVAALHALYPVFTAVKAKSIPDLKLVVIGRDPHPSLAPYAENPDVIFTGAVDSIWPCINATDLFVFPISEGSGQQNKLLEVMYAGRPVVSTRMANGGIGATDGQDIVIGDTPEAIGAAICELLRDESKRQRIGASGAEFVRKHFLWQAIAEQFVRDLSAA